MADDASFTPPPPAPGIVDILPADTVEPLLAHHQQDLHALRLEHEEAFREAEAAERRLHQHPAADIYDDVFEARVMAHVARSISTVLGRGDEVVSDRADAGHFEPENRRPDPPIAAVPSSGSSIDPVVEVPDVQESAPTPRPAPRTVVVDRGAPRTVVVERRPPPPTSLPPPGSVIGPATNGETVASSDPASKSRGKTRAKRQARKAKGHRLQQLPARLLIQAGVVVVIVALLLFKLS